MIRPRGLLAVALAGLILSLGCNLPLLDRATQSDDSPFILGESVEALVATIPSTGGEVSVQEPGSPLDGLRITIPAEAYRDSTQFTVRYRPIESHVFGEKLNPLTPMIEVDNAEAVAARYMIVDIPVEVPPGSFAMAFRFDSTDGSLEGLPVRSIDEDSVSVPMLHFSEFFVTLIVEELLHGEIETGFVVGRDSWPFPNRGSHAQKAGHCAGMTLSALYHYTTNRGEPLASAYDAYDNDHPPTPGLPEDDRLAQRLASAVQAITEIENASATIHSWIDPQHDRPRLTPLTFAYAMWLTGRPQLVHLEGPGGSAHAVLALGKSGDSLRIYDPNHPNEERSLSFDQVTGAMTEYKTGLVAEGAQVPFTRAYFVPAREAVDWETLSGLWRQFQAGLDDGTLFPAYSLFARDAASGATGAPSALASGFRTQARTLRVTFEPQGFGGKAVLYDDSGTSYDAIMPGGFADVTLDGEQTRVGFEIVSCGKDCGEQDRTYWVDFRWVTIVRGEPLATPTVTEPASGNASIEACNALPYLGLAPEIWQDSGASWTGCHFTYRLTNTHPSRDIAVFYYRNANMNFGQFVFDDWEQHYVLAPGATYQLVNMNDHSQGRLQSFQDYPKIGAVFSDGGCRWIYLDPGASGFPFEDLENSCR